MSVCIGGGFIPAAYVSPSYKITSEPEHTGHSGAGLRGSVSRMLVIKSFMPLP